MNTQRKRALVVALTCAALSASKSPVAEAATWRQVPGCAWSLAGNWVVGCGGGTSQGGGAIYYWNGSNWNAATHTTVIGGPNGVTYSTSPEVGVNITTDPSGSPWIVTVRGTVARWLDPFNGFAGFPSNTCEGTTVCIRHDQLGVSTLAVGPNNDVWAVDCEHYSSGGQVDYFAGNYKVRHWNGSCWEEIDTPAQQIAVDSDGTVWITDDHGRQTLNVGGQWPLDPGLVNPSFASVSRGVGLGFNNQIANWYPYGEWLLPATSDSGEPFMQVYATDGEIYSPTPAGHNLYALGVSGGIYQYVPPTAVVFQDQTPAGDPGWINDWDICRGKLTCDDGSGIMGVTSPCWYKGPAHGGVCRSHPSLLFATSTGAVSLDGGTHQRYNHYVDENGTRQDWAPDYYKVECGKGEFVSGLSENVTWGCGDVPTNNGFHAILCSRASDPTALGDVCEVRTPDGQNDDYMTFNDWDPGFWKGGCASDEYLAGISVDGGLNPHSLLCCHGGPI